MMGFSEYGTLFVGPLICKGENLGDMWMNRHGRRILNTIKLTGISLEKKMQGHF